MTQIKLIDVNAGPIRDRYRFGKLRIKLTRNEMSYKTIAVYLARPDSVASIMEVALPLAESFEAHLIGLHVSPGVPVMGTIGAQVPPKIIEQYIEIMHTDAAAIKDVFSTAIKKSKVQSEWRGQDDTSVHPDLLHNITEQTRCADLVIMGQNDSEQRVGDLAADVILGSGRPVITVPSSGEFGKLSGQMVVGWDGSREAARAVFDALPLLKKAKGVSIVTVSEEGEAKDTLGTGGADIARTLSRHGVRAEAVALKKSDKSVGDALLAFTSQQDGELLITGCYSHSRLRERLFGGATQRLLQKMIVPVLMSH